jgi:predicted transcriptional regulator
MNREKAIHFLSLGLPHSQVASILGVSPGRISQLLKEPEVQEALKIKELEVSAESHEVERLEAKILAAKNSLLDAIAQRQHEASFMELAKAFQIIAGAEKQRNTIPVQGATLLGTVVQISLPERIHPEITITKDNEVIAVGERNLAPLAAPAVTALFKRMKEGEDHEPEKLSSGAKEGFGKALQLAAG